MARPSKPANVIALEGKSHRTKAELESREKHEAALLTGKSLAEQDRVREDPLAHELFLRIRKLLRTIGKADAMYEQVINRYALILAECSEFERKRETFYKRALALDQKYEDQDDDTPKSERIKDIDYFRLSAQLQSQIVALDKQVQAKRRMALDIEKECAMTIAAALRAVPKQVEDDSASDPLSKLLGARYG